LVIGLGSHKSLNQWKDEINSFVDKTHMMVGIVGMGPTGIELATILSKHSHITMFDMLPKNKVLDFLRPATKDTILDALEEKEIMTYFAKPYNPSEYKFDKVLFCGGSRPNSLVKNTGMVVNEFLQVNRNIYAGGDCVETGFPKTAQVAYQQGVYVAKYLNCEIPYNKPFEFVSKGTAINIGDKKVIIEGHPIMWDGVYPDFIMKLYSLFCI
jgi:NADH dehydrogenase FAD-containing subunit